MIDRSPSPPALAASLLTALLLLGGAACKGSPEPEPGVQTSARPVAPPAQPPTRYPAAARVVAMGDVHGDLAAFEAALRAGGLVNSRGRWSGGETVLVQTGDVLDRGDDERAILERIEALEVQAANKGGAVVALNGNHETMNVLGDLRYVTPGGLAAFADTPIGDVNLPGAATVPMEARGRLAAFAPGGPWAQHLARHNVIAVVGDTVFLHGGALPAVAAYGIERLNDEARAWMRGEGPVPAPIVDSDGPVWSRHFSDEPDAADCALLAESLTALGAARMVVGHTVQEGGIASACDGKVWRIDVGLAAHYGGPTEVLELTPAGVQVLTPDGPRTP